MATAAVMEPVSDKKEMHVEESSRKSVESIKSIKSVESTQSVESVESVELTKSIESVETESVEMPPPPPPVALAEDEANAETPKMAHDSMVTVRLSEPPSLTLDTSSGSDSEPASSPIVSPKTIDHDTTKDSEDGTPLEVPEIENERNPRESMVMVRDSRIALPRVDTSRSLQDELGQCEDDNSDTSEDQDEVNWEELEKSEDQQTKDEETDNVGVSGLLFSRLC